MATTSPSVSDKLNVSDIFFCYYGCLKNEGLVKKYLLWAFFECLSCKYIFVPEDIPGDVQNDASVNGHSNFRVTIDLKEPILWGVFQTNKKKNGKRSTPCPLWGILIKEQNDTDMKICRKVSVNIDIAHHKLALFDTLWVKTLPKNVFAIKILTMCYCLVLFFILCNSCIYLLLL